MNYRAIALLLFLATACSDEDTSDGIQVTVAIAGATMPAAVTMSGGMSATLEPSYVTVGSFTLEPCPSTATRIWRAVNPLPSALAHGESSPTRLAVPVVVAIVGERARIEVGSLEPPPGRYCGLTLGIEAADDDAVALPDAQMVGKSVRVVGERGDRPFSLSSAARIDPTLTFATPLELSEANSRASLVLTVDTSDAFTAVDLDSVAAVGDALAGLAAGFSVTVQ